MYTRANQSRTQHREQNMNKGKLTMRLYVCIELNLQTVKIDKDDEIRTKITVKWWWKISCIWRKFWRPLYWCVENPQKSWNKSKSIADVEISHSFPQIWSLCLLERAIEWFFTRTNNNRIQNVQKLQMKYHVVLDIILWLHLLFF